MTTILTLTAPLWRGLFDDAAIFPPGSSPMAQALADRVTHHKAWYGATLGPFVCSDRRWLELTAAVHGPPLPLALVVSGGVEAVSGAVATAATEPAVLLHAVEVAGPVDALTVLDAVPYGVQTYLELPPGADVSALSGTRHRAKFRTGGDTAATPDELATAILSCVAHDVSFKLTGGLHHAVAGDGSFGFLNVLNAVATAIAGGPYDLVLSALIDADATSVVARIQALSDEQGRRVRRSFVSFGTCSIIEPVEDLRALGLA